MCQGWRTARSAGPKIRASRPPPARMSAVIASSTEPLAPIPARTRQKLRQTARSITRLTSAMTSRNPEEMAVPTRPIKSFIASNCCPIAAVDIATTRVASTTTVEWPSEKYSPTSIGRCRSTGGLTCICARTTLSIAAIWSGSTAWRRPNTQASRAVPSSVG